MAVLLPPTRHLDIVWQAGDDTPAVIPVPDHQGGELDVTGWSASVIVVANGREVHRWSTEDGSAVCGLDGVTLLADDSAGWSWCRGRYDLRVQGPDATRRVPAAGDMFVRPMQTSSGSAPDPGNGGDVTEIVEALLAAHDADPAAHPALRDLIATSNNGDGTGAGPLAFDQLTDVEAPAGMPGLLERGTDGVIRPVTLADVRTDVFSGDGPPPAVVPGAGYGDLFIDRTTGQLYRLT